MPPPAYILAGGQSRRFGSDKARAVIEGQPVIVRLARQLAEMGSEPLVVADRPGKYADLELTTIADRKPGQGPLGGLETALLHARRPEGARWILLLSCDLAEVRSDWIESLSAGMPAAGGACAFRGEFWHPFPGVYHVDLLPPVQDYLRSEKASFQRLLSDPRAGATALPLPANWPALAQINTPEDWAKVRGKDV